MKREDKNLCFYSFLLILAVPAVSKVPNWRLDPPNNISCHSLLFIMQTQQPISDCLWVSSYNTDVGGEEHERHHYYNHCNVGCTAL